jgi:uncharacterized protein (TIGR02246 family)
MKMTVKAMTVLICTFIVASMISASPAQQARPEDEAAIRRIVSRLEAGWNAGSGKDFAAPFDEDADYVVINGTHINGRKEIDAGHQHIFDTIYKNSHQSSMIQSIRFLSDTIAIAHVEWNLKWGDSREGRAMNSLVLRKRNGQWSIAAFHNTPIESSRK